MIAMKKPKTLTPEMREYLRKLGSAGGKKKAEGMSAKDRKTLGQRLSKARRAAAKRKRESGR
jgi:hypothetical protein